MIAIAIAASPKLLIADEATTALDVTTQAQILALMRTLCEELGMALLWITHDMGVVAAMASRVLVMYAGQIVETGDVERLFRNPRHPYTRRLLSCAPSMSRRSHPLPVIEGVVPRSGEASARMPLRAALSRPAADVCARRAPAHRGGSLSCRS